MQWLSHHPTCLVGRRSSDPNPIAVIVDLHSTDDAGDVRPDQSAHLQEETRTINAVQLKSA